MLQIYLSTVIFLFGLIVGSFLNCLIYRLEIGGNFWKGRSFCPYCKHKLGFFDLIPVFSFFLLGRKCRYCQKPISFQYPIVELATGILFSLIFWNLPAPLEAEGFLMGEFGVYLEFGIWDLLFYWLVASLLIVVFVYDLKHYIIPDKIIYPAIAVTLIFNFRTLISDYLILSALVAAAFFLSIVLLSHGKWMGLGDVKLAFLIGLFLGWPNVFVALFLAFFIGAIIGIGLIAFGKKKLQSEVPFGPFLVAGSFIALFWGQNIIDWYLNYV